MKKTLFTLFAFMILELMLPFIKVNAGECCGCDPIYDRNLKAEYNISAYVLDIPCMKNNQKLAIGQKGWVVKVIGETDGWYKVQLPNGTIGWSGARLMTITDKPLTVLTSTTTTTSTSSNYVPSSISKYKGYIFLAVEANGEAYYYYPVNGKVYYLGRPADAFNIMRTLGLGATHDFIANTTYFPSHVVGRILLDVESHGEAYYIYPKDRKKYYLGRPEDAFRVMKELGLGISNSNLSLIPKAN